MRGRFWASLLLITALPMLGGRFAGADDPRQTAEDEKTLQAAKVGTDDKSLLDFFRNRTLDDAGREKLKALVKDLGADSFRVREKAFLALVTRGSVALPYLKEALKSDDLEVSRRAEVCIQRIGQHDQNFDVLTAALRRLAAKKPAGAVPALLDYLPFADADRLTDEVTGALAALAVRDGKADLALVAALTSKDARRRGAAGEALCRAGVASEKEAVRKLLRDPDTGVRLQVGMALARAADRDAVPVLIEMLGQLPQSEGGQIEEFLFRLADGKSPPTRVLTGDAEGRRLCSADWAAWWSKNGKDIDLARAARGPALHGFTTIVLLDRNEILELDPRKQVRWKIENVVYPLDVQYLPGDRVLVAEYHANRVTERDLKGRVVWEQRAAAPQAAQRLANGNTFICSDTQMVEVNREHKEVFQYATDNGERIMKALKLANGQVVALMSDGALLNDPRVVRISDKGKELGSFTVRMRTRLFGGRLDVLPNGHILVPFHLENKVVEFDPNGKAVWQVAVDMPVVATRLPNGNTLVTSMAQNRAVEFNRAGAEVWEYRSDTRVTRAVRR